jgi:hypothetical protein
MNCFRKELLLPLQSIGLFTPSTPFMTALNPSMMTIIPNLVLQPLDGNPISGSIECSRTSDRLTISQLS